jgi:hypothetical protein
MKTEISGKRDDIEYHKGGNGKGHSGDRGRELFGRWLWSFFIG